MTSTTVDWTEQLSEQLEWHWRGQLRPRFDGLTDDEYRWEPAQPAWNVRPRSGEGQWVIAERYEIDLDSPWEELSEEQQDLFLYGTNGDRIYVSYRNRIGTLYVFQTKVTLDLTLYISPVFRTDRIPTTCVFYYQSPHEN